MYCAIGQRASTVAKTVATLQEKGAMEYTVVVVAEGKRSSGPYLYCALCCHQHC